MGDQCDSAVLTVVVSSWEACLSLQLVDGGDQYGSAVLTVVVSSWDYVVV